MTVESISTNSRRVARNTALLYVRMMLLMLIGLFTSRIVLKVLGINDYGIYNVVYGLVMMFTVLTNSVSNAISRFLTVELGRSNDSTAVHKVFSSAIIIQAGVSLLLIILTETVGIRYLHNHIVLPPGREAAAFCVLQCSALMLVVQLFSIPFNATIIAHEQMKAFAWISILEAILKLGVAFALYFTAFDKLESYAVLMVLVAVLVRGTYAFYCHRHFEETRGRLTFDHGTIRQMLGFSGWSFLGNGVAVMNTQGINLLSNAFFGVRINAARGIAGQVENITKQFVSNFLTALNPQIMKSWAGGQREYSYELVTKGCKFTFLIMLFFTLPLCFEGDALLALWLGEVPPHAATFTALTLLYVIVDMTANSLFQLVMANGKVALYYIVTSAICLSAFALSWISFATGGEPETSFWILIGTGLLADAAKLVFADRLTGLAVRTFLAEAVERPFLAALLACIPCCIITLLLPESGWRLLLTLTASTLSLCLFCRAFVLTDGERKFIRETISKWRK